MQLPKQLNSFHTFTQHNNYSQSQTFGNHGNIQEIKGLTQYSITHAQVGTASQSTHSSVIPLQHVERLANQSSFSNVHTFINSHRSISSISDHQTLTTGHHHYDHEHHQEFDPFLFSNTFF
ncbi:hypothetical protein HMI55_004358 [Coelomomyces lativittatus]|nr:hypothetical protein HMI55_004358 [Coelomomyces lativittatus]KAJ1513472.1 hypothetical protein HMI56_002395 [Coelomomyces lativittatus]